MKYIPQCCAAQRGDNAHALRITREFLFCIGIKQPFCLELELEFFELGLQLAHALQLHLLHDELILPARLVHGEVTVQHHFLAILHEFPLRRACAAKENARELRAFILDCKIAMTRSLQTQIGNFPLNPNLADLVFQLALHTVCELGNRKDIARFLHWKQFSEVPLGLGFSGHN